MLTASCVFITVIHRAPIAVTTVLRLPYAEAEITRVARGAEIAVITRCLSGNGFSYAVHFFEELYAFIVRGTGIAVVA
jgi:hypothetical protein